MKTIKLFIVATLLLTINSYGQLDKGIWLVGGSSSFNFYENEQTITWQTTGEKQTTTWRTREIDLSAKVGYFIIDKLAIGLTPTYSYSFSDMKNNESQLGPTSKLLFGPFVRYYFLDKEKPFNILIESSYQKGIIKFDDEKGKINKFLFLVGPELFFNSSVGIDLLLGYNVNNQKMDSAYLTSSTNKGLQFSIGLQVHLEKLKKY